MVAQSRKSRRRLRVAPRNVAQHLVADREVPIDGVALPLAERASFRTAQQPGIQVVGRQVPTGRMTGLERADGTARISNEDAAMLNANPPITGFGNRRTGKAPHARLAKRDGVGFGPPAP